jgi:hypothetical protein
MRAIWQYILPVLFQLGWGLFWYNVRAKMRLEVAQSDAFVFIFPALVAMVWMIYSRWPPTIGSILFTALIVVVVWALTTLLALNFIGS